MREHGPGRTRTVPRKRLVTEQIVTKLRQFEVTRTHDRASDFHAKSIA